MHRLFDLLFISALLVGCAFPPSDFQAESMARAQAMNEWLDSLR